ncbi:MAG: DUF1080 domain-containing protein [Planctomycetota bacterium]|nr:DUF1080 domain-containing protein [Planctomycetota bacterium]
MILTLVKARALFATISVLLFSLSIVLMVNGCVSKSQALFNGHDLKGWTRVGGEATFVVEEGSIVGTHGPGANTFLRTEGVYKNFELELDFKWDEQGNSGIQFRSHQRPGDGVVEGYQCELDPTERAWTCGLYYEGPRGWLVPLDNAPEAQAARRLTGWNRIRIRANGPRLQIWLNGVSCVDYIDHDGDREGFIALQVHSGDVGRMRWKHIRLTELKD